MPYNSMCRFQRTTPGKLATEHESSANLPSKFTKTQVVGVTGLEPVTLRLSSACSNQLSYTPNEVGGAEETRTPDL